MTILPYFLSDLDKFMTDDMDPITKAKMVALKGIKRVLTQDPINVPPGINRYLIQYKATCLHCCLQLYIYICCLLITFCLGNRYPFWLRGWHWLLGVQKLRPTLVLDHLRSVLCPFFVLFCWLHVLVSLIVTLLLILGRGKL